MSKKLNKIYEDNAKRRNLYGGKRFLGFTPNGNDVWTTMRFEKDSKELNVDLGKGFSKLYDQRSFLSPTRVHIKLSQPKPINLRRELQRNSRNAGGKVSIRTLEYIEKLKSAVDSKQSKSHVKEIPTKLLFQYVASVIYPGDLDEKNGFRWSDVTNIWGLPSGEYFTIDSFPSSKDNKE